MIIILLVVSIKFVIFQFPIRPLNINMSLMAIESPLHMKKKRRNMNIKNIKVYLGR